MKKIGLLINPNFKYANYDDIEIPCQRMCKTCAYRTSASAEEIEAERDIYIERGNQSHACHEDNQYYCRGNWELTKKMGLHE